MKKSNRGRKQSITDEMLDSAFKNYISKYPNEEVDYGRLIEESGIPRHIWNNRRRELISTYNENIRNQYILNDDDVQTSSAYELFEYCNENIDDFLIFVQGILDSYAKIAINGDVEKKIEEIKFKHQEEIGELKYQLEEKDKTIKELNDKINNMMYDSMFEDKREEQGIKDNQLEFSYSNILSFEDLVNKYNKRHQK